LRDLTRRKLGQTEELGHITLASYDEIRKRISQSSDSSQIYDLIPVFDTAVEEKWFMDNVHFLDPGHQDVAEAMLPEVSFALSKVFSNLNFTDDRNPDATEKSRTDEIKAHK